MIRKYKAGDARQVMAQAAQQDEAQDDRDGFENITAYTLVGNEGRVLAVFGFAKAEDGAGDVYALLGQDCGGKMTELFRFMKKELRRLMKSHGCEVARATVKKGFAAGERFIAMLGFSYQGTLPQFYNGNDYLLFEKEEKCINY